MADEPDELVERLDAYGRVTNPERFLAVQEAAIALADRLSQRFRVRRSEPSPAPDLVARLRATRTIRLDPDDDEAGPLVITFTDFPGVILTLGGGCERAFPSCGCDACNEHPDRVVQELLDTVERFVHGGLVESVSGNTYSFRLGGLSSTGVIDDADPRQALPSYRSWKEWPRR